MSSLVKKLDREFSRFIRLRHASRDGMVECVTCGKTLHWKECHASHFVSRRHMATRWHELNVNVCCPRCNLYESGALDEYSRWIIQEHGMSTFDDLLALKRTTKKWTQPELLELIDKYKTAARELEARISGV
jgi:endogenous inhibitor of DNA gyrase (YacG/DUF329 family)